MLGMLGLGWVFCEGLWMLSWGVGEFGGEEKGEELIGEVLIGEGGMEWDGMDVL